MEFDSIEKMEGEDIKYDNTSLEYYYYYYDDTTASNWIDYSHLKGAYNVKRVLQPVLVVVGMLGNLLTVKVLRGKLFCHQSVKLYISAYAIMCMLILFIDLGCEWLFNIIERPSIKCLTDWGCRLWQFVFNVVIYSVQWLIVAVAVDRYTAIWHPTSSKRMCTYLFSKFAVVVIAIGLVVVSIHALWTYELVDYSNIGIMKMDCIVGGQDLHSRIWIWVSTSMYKYIPLLLLLVFNTLILVGLFIKRDTLFCPEVRTQKLHKLTNAGVALTTVFFLNTAPVTILEIVGYQLFEKFHSDRGLHIHYSFIYEVCTQLAYIHLATSFLLCMIFSKLFRKQFYITVQGVLKCSSQKGYKSRIIQSFRRKKSQRDDSDSAGETAV